MSEKESKKGNRKVSVELDIPEGVTVTVNDDSVVSFKGSFGEDSRRFHNPIYHVRVENNKIIIESRSGKANKTLKMLMMTALAHIKNMLRGVQEGHEYKLKICSGHFPMNASVSNNQFIIKNFIGEKVPRVLDIKEGVDIKVDGDIITLKSVSKEKAGNVASDLEKMTRRKGFDPRIFQDGIYITEKDGKKIH